MEIKYFRGQTVALDGKPVGPPHTTATGYLTGSDTKRTVGPPQHRALDPSRAATRAAPTPRPAASPQPTAGPDEVLVRSVRWYDVDSVVTATVKHLLPHLISELGLPRHTRVEYFRPETPADRGFRSLGPVGWKVAAVPDGCAGCVAPEHPCTIWIDADIDPADVPEVLAHEARHVMQLAGHGDLAPDVVRRFRADLEADAGAYGRDLAARWCQQ